jgi:tRNA-Thr(GGU) m(6)t(6)A37 methyltransferase TsaA
MLSRAYGFGARGKGNMEVTVKSIGVVRTRAESVPRHWTVSEVEGTLEIDPEYREGLKDIQPGQRMVVIFHFHQSPPFDPEMLVQTPPHRQGERVGVFSICSPRRPNPIGLSVFQVLGVEGTTIRVKGLDTYDGTPILDIKPWVEKE